MQNLEFLWKWNAKKTHPLQLLIFPLALSPKPAQLSLYLIRFEASQLLFWVLYSVPRFAGVELGFFASWKSRLSSSPIQEKSDVVDHSTRPFLQLEMFSLRNLLTSTEITLGKIMSKKIYLFEVRKFVREAACSRSAWSRGQLGLFEVLLWPFQTLWNIWFVIYKKKFFMTFKNIQNLPFLRLFNSFKLDWFVSWSSFNLASRLFTSHSLLLNSRALIKHSDMSGFEWMRKQDIQGVLFFYAYFEVL